ncbi:hypothetical protein L0657_19315 [Dyadobacter sp. CY345]|uniref:hypothetical protein n=1 Tax=Dyadobacter sp. CY345 TaxID=2909335 RepID=UPI001F254087|nr:hypothetical protein [Dyadobacter sp. CY345]MCF2446115.1 hypothetical protein [Dyadobacter sp. CY345]
MKFVKIIFFLVLTVAFFSCAKEEKEKEMSSDEIVKIGMSPCRSSALFIKDFGFDPTRSDLSTTEPGMVGVVLVEHPRKAADSLSRRTYQDVSWTQNGWMGNTTVDIDGNIYTAPFPKENETNIPLKQMDKVFKIDAKTGKMDVLLELSKPGSSAETVPFAVLGLYYDCHGKKLYVSSVSGSTKTKENGIIYVVDPPTGKVVDQLKGHDAAAVFVGGFTGEKRLYFGGLRTSDIYSVQLTEDGKFKGKARSEGTLLHPGNSGNDRARSIRFDENGNLLVSASSFDFTLTDAAVKKETSYQFSYDKGKKKWRLVDGG